MQVGEGDGAEHLHLAPFGRTAAPAMKMVDHRLQRNFSAEPFGEAGDAIMTHVGGAKAAGDAHNGVRIIHKPINLPTRHLIASMIAVMDSTRTKREQAATYGRLFDDGSGGGNVQPL